MAQKRIVKLRLTDDQHDQIASRAHASGETIEEWIIAEVLASIRLRKRAGGIVKNARRMEKA